ncbi:MAG TPA: glycoside hydrolase family 2 TIM barrel-domain containing protein, partial [Oceanipulchritudo sp.]|nr:glycoside hydrolase family 2 TIM barrel-domain containing protein [Oceanipulchritudo sp.]
MRIPVLFLLLLPLGLFAERHRATINEGWFFHRGDITLEQAQAQSPDVGWEKVSLPHSWNVQDAFDTVNGPGVPEHLAVMDYYYRGPAWYVREIDIPSDWQNRRIAVHFEAAMQRTHVYANGTWLGEYVGGYTAFSFDITPVAQPGETVTLAVRVDNSYHYDIPPHRADYTMFGGLYRDVWLETTAPLYADQVFLTTPQVQEDMARISPRIELRNHHRETRSITAVVSIRDADGALVGQQKTTADVPAESAMEVGIPTFELTDPNLWSPASPHLYTATTEVLVEDNGVDRREDRFGLRWFSFDPDRGFILNGKALKLKGVNRHQDVAGYGFAVPNHLHRRDMELIKEMGANFVRLAHYPQDPAILKAANELGLLIWEEIPVVTGVGREGFAATAKTMLRDMITQHYNHPSIILWGLMNETIRSQPDEDLHWTVELCRDLNKIAKELDPHRLTVQAQYAARGTDIFDHADIRGWNRYFGWYYEDFDAFPKWLDTQRKAHPEEIIIISEYGAGSLRGFHKEQPSESDFSETWGTAFHKAYWRALAERPWVGGSAVWNMFDFASEEKGGNEQGINQKGLADNQRRPKDVYYFYQSQWADEPM